MEYNANNNNIVRLISIIGVVVCFTVNNNCDVSSFVVPSSSTSTKIIQRASSSSFSHTPRLHNLRMAADDDDSDDDDDGGMDWMSGPPAGQPEMEIIECDVAIIGGGPAGATCALYTSRADLTTVILDKNEAVGALAITSHIANYPGVDRAMTGMELLQQMKTQAKEYGTRIVERAQVFMIEIKTDMVEKDENGNKPYNKVIYTPDCTVHARSIVLATGAMGRSMPYLPGEEKYLGQGVSYCATCDGAFYRDAEVAVFGATGEALEEALFLTKFASKVHWITPIDVTGYLDRLEHDKLSVGNVEFNHLFEEETLKDFLALSNVEHHNKARLREVEGNVSGVTGVRVRNQGGKKADDTIIAVEGAFIYGAGGGSKPITEFLSGSGIDLDDAGGVVVDDSMESTSQKGVFGIGDIRNTPYKQVVVAAADGCIAAMSIEKYLKDRKNIKVDWIHK